MRDAIQQSAGGGGGGESGTPVFGTVLDIDPWTIELHGAATVLDADDLTISRWVEQYHHWVGVEVDDTAVLVEMEDGDYVVVDVVTDSDLLDLPGVGGFVPYTGATSDLNLGSHKLIFTDVNLYRSAANVLKTDDHLYIGPPAAATAGLSVAYQGSTHAVIFNRTGGNPVNGNVLLVTAQDLGTDADAMDSTVGISGYETGKGTVKIDHRKPVAAVTGSDGNASALSLRCNGAGTAAQGIFFDAEDAGGTTGKLLNFRQQGVEKFVVAADGAITSQGKLTLPLAGNTGGLLVGGDCNLYRTAADNWRTDDLFMVVRASAGTPALSATVSGSSPANFVINADGGMEWGSGAATRDVTLYRASANVLKTDDALTVVGNINAQGAIFGGLTSLTSSGANATLLSLKPPGASQAALLVTGEGRMAWGDGSSAQDVYLKRVAAGVLALRNDADNGYTSLRAATPATAMGLNDVLVRGAHDLGRSRAGNTRPRAGRVFALNLVDQTANTEFDITNFSYTTDSGLPVLQINDPSTGASIITRAKDMHDMDIRIKYKLAAKGIYAVANNDANRLMARYASATDNLFVWKRFATALDIAGEKLSGAETYYGSGITSDSDITNTTTYRYLRLQVFEDVVRYKSWFADAAEPTGWLEEFRVYPGQVGTKDLLNTGGAGFFLQYGGMFIAEMRVVELLRDPENILLNNDAGWQEADGKPFFWIPHGNTAITSGNVRDVTTVNDQYGDSRKVFHVAQNVANTAGGLLWNHQMWNIEARGKSVWNPDRTRPTPAGMLPNAIDVSVWSKGQSVALNGASYGAIVVMYYWDEQINALNQALSRPEYYKMLGPNPGPTDTNPGCGTWDWMETRFRIPIYWGGSPWVYTDIAIGMHEGPVTGEIWWTDPVFRPCA